jgi:hypothetical protein
MASLLIHHPVGTVGANRASSTAATADSSLLTFGCLSIAAVDTLLHLSQPSVMVVQATIDGGGLCQQQRLLVSEEG